MKVVVTIALDIDAAAWTDNYGTEGAAAIRAEVKTFAASDLKGHLDDLGVLGEWSPK